MNALIVDDEDYARSSLFFLIQEHCPEIKHVAFANSVANAVSLLQENVFQLTFLDIAMPHENGFELLPHLQKSKTPVIFTTAYDQYAIKAIKVSAVDYLLKPIDIDELKEAVAKVFAMHVNEVVPVESYKQLIEQVNTGELKKITLPSASGSKIVDIKDIIKIEADSNYSTFYFQNEGSITVAKSLKEYEEILPESTFFRVHKSSIVNLEYIKNYNKGSLELQLKNNDIVIVSRRRHSDFVECLKKMAINKSV